MFRPAPDRRTRRSLGRRLIAAALGLLIFAVVLLGVTEFVAGWRPAYRAALRAATPEAAAGLDLPSRTAALDRVLAYSLGRAEEMQFALPPGAARPGAPAFSQRELDHMVDVRDLFSLARRLRWGLLAVLGVVAGGLLLAARRRGRGDGDGRLTWLVLAEAGVAAGLWGLVFGLVVGTAAAVDFGRAFDGFHLLLFDNDLWLLPLDSLLINLLPTWQFARLAGLIGAGSGVLLGAVAIAGGVAARRLNRVMAGLPT